jgi:hypothetical protein
VHSLKKKPPPVHRRPSMAQAATDSLTSLVAKLAPALCLPYALRSHLEAPMSSVAASARALLYPIDGSKVFGGVATRGFAHGRRGCCGFARAPHACATLTPVTFGASAHRDKGTRHCRRASSTRRLTDVSCHSNDLAHILWVVRTTAPVIPWVAVSSPLVCTPAVLQVL